MVEISRIIAITPNSFHFISPSGCKDKGICVVKYLQGHKLTYFVVRVFREPVMTRRTAKNTWNPLHAIVIKYMH